MCRRWRSSKRGSAGVAVPLKTDKTLMDFQCKVGKTRRAQEFTTTQSRECMAAGVVPRNVTRCVDATKGWCSGSCGDRASLRSAALPDHSVSLTSMCKLATTLLLVCSFWRGGSTATLSAWLPACSNGVLCRCEIRNTLPSPFETGCRLAYRHSSCCVDIADVVVECGSISVPASGAHQLATIHSAAR